MDFFKQNYMFSNRISKELKNIFEIESSYYTYGMSRTGLSTGSGSKDGCPYRTAVGALIK